MSYFIRISQFFRCKISEKDMAQQDVSHLIINAELD